jgi:methyl coenzyme M reductase alpha subunit
MDRYKVNRIVEFVRSAGDFPYDCDDVIERMADILTEYGIYSVFTTEEYALLMDELLEISENAEIAEAARWASIELVTDQDLRWGTDTRVPGWV